MKREVDTRDTVKVVTSNNFLRAAGLENISVKARKLLYLALAQCRKQDNDFFEYAVSVKDFADFMGVDASNVYRSADEITDELMRGFIKFKPAGKKDFVKFQLFQTCKYVDGVGLVFQLSPDMTDIMLNLKKDFTQALLSDFAKMRSNYSMEIWHLLQQRMQQRPGITDTIILDVPVEDIRKITGTVEKFERISQFKAKVWDKALKEIRENCWIDVTYTDIKTGRSITAFRCTIQTRFHVDESAVSPDVKARVDKTVSRLRYKELTASEQAEYDRLTKNAEQITMKF